ncbi:helix-turn-helix transcriptional regulator [Frankia nepalensis]|uniref:helix-turn-helix transcriptional regulator n=1 Tax=Frankia nepalensis TaxID=1836974 RepID=UPI00288B88B8|nr:helix-turn-helix domain-containing protein [Frankia nepalensis]
MSAGSDGRTRDRVVRILLEGGPATAAELARRLELSPAAVRRHLDAMVSDGIIAPTSVHTRGPRGRGRPARHYRLTDAGHEEAGPTAYSDLAVGALHFLDEVAGSDAVTRFAESRGRELEIRLAGAVNGVSADQRPAALAAAMTAAGYTASVSEVPSGTQICQHHCPVQHVAERFPALCEAETAALSRLLHTHVVRLATIAHGDGVCTTHVPAKADGITDAVTDTDVVTDATDVATDTRAHPVTGTSPDPPDRAGTRSVGAPQRSDRGPSRIGGADLGGPGAARDAQASFEPAAAPCSAKGTGAVVPVRITTEGPST